MPYLLRANGSALVLVPFHAVMPPPQLRRRSVLRDR
jgi:hypothetical protein